MKKIYTKTGDDGTTRLIDGFAGKDDLRVQAYGDIDEADSILGLARNACLHEVNREVIFAIQKQLKLVMAETASVKGGWFAEGISAVNWLENCIDTLSAELSPLTELIIPGGKNGSAMLHLARTVVRRAERSAVALKRANGLNENVIVYLNRLSDLCFVMARYEDEYSN